MSGAGTFLTATNPTSIAATVTRMEGTSPADMMEIRQLLEPAAAAFAATNASATELNAVREAHQAACDAKDMPDFEHWDAEFHHRIFACSRNDFLKEIHNLMRILRNQSPWFEMKKRSFSEERRQHLLRRAPGDPRRAASRDPEARARRRCSRICRPSSAICSALRAIAGKVATVFRPELRKNKDLERIIGSKKR